MLIRLFIALFCLGVSVSSLAQTVDVNISDDSAQFSYVGSLGDKALGRTEWEAGFLYTTDDDILGMAAINVVDEAGSGSPGLEAGAGIKAFAISTKGPDVAALALGGQLRYRVPPHNRIGIGVQGYYAPDILSFMDADSLWTIEVRAGYEIVPQAAAYIGYRKYRASIENGPNATIDQGFHVGLRMSF